jgi:hypothetical protein
MEKQQVDQLRQRYPNIFADLGGGFMCGEGWFDLIDTLCEQLQFATDHNGAPQAVAVQVKEKFGTLSFYTREVSAAQRGMIAMACAMSARLCEKCGQPGLTLVKGAWQTRCPAHAPEEAMTKEEFLARQGARLFAPRLTP